MQDATMNGAFAGLRVIDLSERLSGAWAARLFGDFGAEVALVEPPGGCALRREPPFLDDEPGAERSLLHAYANWNKRSIVAGDAEEVSALAQQADLLITTAMAPWPERVAAAVASLAPNAVHLSITPHGLEGPLAQVPSNNLTLCARTGWTAINRLADEPPLQLPARQSGYIAGVAGHVGAAAALFRRAATGSGERVDVSELEALALTNVPWAILGLFVGGKRLEHGPGGMRRRGEPAPLWETANGPMNFGFGDWARWAEAMRFLGLDELAEDPTYAPVLGRNTQDPAPIRAALAGAAAERDKWELFHGLAQLRCLSGVVQNARELAESEQLNERGFIVETPVAGRSLRTAGAPVQLSDTPWRLQRPAPQLDEHGDTLRREWQAREAATSTNQPSATKRQQAAPRPLRGSAAASPNAADAEEGTPNPTSTRNANANANTGAAPLQGVRVLAFTQAWAGTFATQLLALLGADVVQIESPKRPDVWRGAGAPVPPAVRRPDIKQSPLNTNGMYNSVNLGKRAITLDMTHPLGRDIFWRLVPRFDVVADNFSPHVMPNWGVTLETLRTARPDIVFASISGFGTVGPFAEYPANGHTIEPMSGLASIHGYEGDAAANTGGLIPDPISGYYFAAGILAALNHRQRGGVGQRIDGAMMEAVAVQVGDALLEFEASGRVPRPAGNRHPRCAPHGAYPARDGGWLLLAVETDAAWAALAQRYGIADARFADAAGRKADETELDAVLKRHIAQLDADAEAQALGALGICAAAATGFQALYAEPCEQFRQRGFMASVTHPESGTHFMPGAPWVLSSTARPPLGPAPCFGEHSQEVLRDELGIGDAEYAELTALGVTGAKRLSA